MYDDIAFIRRLSGVERRLDFRDGFFKVLEWIWVRLFWMKIPNSPTRSRSSDEALLTQGTNVSDAYIYICTSSIVDEQELFIVELGASASVCSVASVNIKHWMAQTNLI